jgi:hypothetical protein
MKSGAKMKLMLVLVGVVVIGGGSFFGGYQVGKSSGPGGRQFGGLGQNGFRTDTGGNSFVTGEVISRDDTSVTVKLPSGGSQIVFVSDSTQITKSASGTMEDLTTGTQISASGSENTDGSISAKSVQVRPNMLTDQGQTPPVSNQTTTQ